MRELQNILERGVVLSQGPLLTLGRELFPAHSFAKTPASTKAMAAVADVARREIESPYVPIPKPAETTLSLKEVERRHILDVLKETNWVIEGPKGAAQVLNLHPNTLRSRLKKLGIQRAAINSRGLPATT